MLHSYSCKQKVEFISILTNKTGLLFSAPQLRKIKAQSTAEQIELILANLCKRKTWMCTWFPEETQKLSIALICIMTRAFASVFKEEFPLECEIQDKSDG